MFCIIMGVAGSGKSTVGKLLSQRLGWQFYDADDFHTPENIAKMSLGLPLSDRDREPWLDRLKQLIEQTINQGNSGILACSALKSSYRQFLTQEQKNEICWVYLRGDYQLISTRIKQRQQHFFKEEILNTQFANLEEPTEALIIDVSLSPDAIVDTILAYLSD
ncbi:gluconate kinase, SKI family [Stanieria cyanosphaera PCC 7437]|uniref:Gluconokinase n=1 Tax=Stanieria cyanosphaera (strain ATCC 29371 / PCC 7437) TaxID=111780 RepID=K9XQ35_STAC7|nr:gluconokinase [Stanieria cyanosphaera]AFZ33787.1 gluconate kinase, SKI family [Stanieria cyanosphaera PCC 7437]